MKLTEVIAIMMVLIMGLTIKRTIEEKCPEAYEQYLKNRAKMPFYKRIWYMK